MNKEENKTCKSDDCSEWKTLVQNFVTNMLSKLSDNISERVQVWFRNVVKRGAGVFLMMFGFTFLMISISLYLNSVWADQGSWVGYGVVGLVVCSVGLFMSKK